MYKRVVIGIDQSYKDTGICVIADGVVRDIKHINLSKLQNNSAKRDKIRHVLTSLLDIITPKAGEIICIIERIRLRSQGFINIDYIKSIGALNTVIVDTFNNYGICVYSVDTRRWKATVVGTCKGSNNNYGVPPEKWPTVKWAIELGLEKYLLVDHGERSKKRNGVFTKYGNVYSYNDNAADACGIAWYGELYGVEELKQADLGKLQLEK